MTGFRLDPDRLARVADALDREREALDTATDVVASQPGGAAGPWGADRQGSMFGAIMATVLDHVLEVMDSHVDQLHYAATELRSWAADARQVDETVAARMLALDPRSQ